MKELIHQILVITENKEFDYNEKKIRIELLLSKFECETKMNVFNEIFIKNKQSHS